MTTHKKKKIVQKKRKAHKHCWDYDISDFCGACGAYEAICRDCDKIALFSNGGTLLDIMG